VDKHQRRKLTVILHADVVGSTMLVQRDETLAHHRMQDSFRRFSETIRAYGGSTHELRGDALVAEFDRLWGERVTRTRDVVPNVQQLEA